MLSGYRNIPSDEWYVKVFSCDVVEFEAEVAIGYICALELRHICYGSHGSLMVEYCVCAQVHLTSQVVPASSMQHTQLSHLQVSARRRSLSQNSAKEIREMLWMTWWQLTVTSSSVSPQVKAKLPAKLLQASAGGLTRHFPACRITVAE